MSRSRIGRGSARGLLIASVILVGAWFVATGTASAAGNQTLFASASSSNTTTPCTNSADPCTLAVAIGEANGDTGDTIVLADGTYRAPTGGLPAITSVQTWTGQSQGGTIVSGVAGMTSAIVTVNSPINSGTVTIQDLTITGGTNSGAFSSGVLNNGTLMLANDTVSNNSGPGGGGGLSNDGTATLTGDTFTGDSARQVGGAIFNAGGHTITLTDDSLSDDSTNLGSGGGGAISNDGTAVLTDDTLSNDSADNGGAISNDGTVTLTNDTLSGNTAPGGGSDLDNTNIATLTSDTLSGAGSVGSAVLNDGTTTLAADVLANGASGGNCVDDAGPIVSGGDNAADDATCSPDGSKGDRTDLNPTLDLGSFGNHGGHTDTVPLVADASPPNPAIGAVTNPMYCPAADQRGVARPSTGCDAGAFEVPSLTVTASDASRPFGAANPALSATLSGFVFGQGPSLVSGSAACSTTATATSPPGTYPITCSRGSLDSSEYLFGPFVPGTLTVTPTPTTAPGPKPPVAPKLSQLRIKPHAFEAANKGKVIIARIESGATITYRDTLAAHTTFLVYRDLPGIKRGKKCVPPVRGGHTGKVTHCTRLQLVGGFSHQDRKGANRLHFTGRIRHRALRAGGYTLKADAKLAGQKSRTLTASFVILARPVSCKDPDHDGDCDAPGQV